MPDQGPQGLRQGWRSSLLSARGWWAPGARRPRRCRVSAVGGGIAMDLMQERLDLVQLTFDRGQPLGHADHLRPARQVQGKEIFLHELTELLLRSRRDP